MRAEEFHALDLNIAQARIALSLLALSSVYIDPDIGGFFRLDSHVLTTLLCHLAYSLIVYFALRQSGASKFIQTISPVLDLGFATAVALFAEGQTSPSYIFFVFAIIAVGFRTAFRDTVVVTACGVALYLLVIAITHGLTNSYAMRAVYLAIAGYLIGFFGEQRVKFEARLRELEGLAERQNIARSLHDGYIQALAGVNLRLETCRGLIRRQMPEEALDELTDLQRGVAREYDDVRSYIRWLADVEDEGAALSQGAERTRFRIRAAFDGQGTLVEHVLHIMLEGMRNAVRHGHASQVRVDVGGDDAIIRIVVDDDGVGFAKTDVHPWTMQSRVAEFGGRISVTNNQPSGAHVEIEIPAL